MSSQNSVNQKLVSLFSEQPCWQLETLAQKLHYSIRSIQRLLFKVGYHRSFSYNGRWYTLLHIPEFNRDGLWFSTDIGFSSTGNLNNTLIKLIDRSSAGMTAQALREKLHCRCHTVLVQLCRLGKLQREKTGRSFAYFSSNHRIADNQRQDMTIQTLSTATLPAEIAVFILVEFIRNPKSSFEELAKTLKDNRKISVNAAQIERLFEQYGVKKLHKQWRSCIEGLKAKFRTASSRNNSSSFVFTSASCSILSRNYNMPMRQFSLCAKDQTKDCLLFNRPICSP
jgi:hypothetical protein